jgi:hypothetical protein
VRQQNALQSVRRECPLQTKLAEQRGQPALATVNAQNTKYRHQHGQDQRHGAQAQQGLPAGKTPPIKRARKKNSRDRRQQGRKKRLPEGETDNVPEIAVVPEGEQVALGALNHSARNPRLTATITMAASSPGSNQPGING